MKEKMKSALAVDDLTLLVESINDKNAADIASKVGNRLKELSRITVFPKESRHKHEHRLRWAESEAKALETFAIDWWSRFSEALRRKNPSALAPMDVFFSRNTLVEHIKVYRRFLSRVAIPYSTADSEGLAALIDAFDGTAEFCAHQLEYEVALLASRPSRRIALVKEISSGPAFRLRRGVRGCRPSSYSMERAQLLVGEIPPSFPRSLCERWWIT